MTNGKFDVAEEIYKLYRNYVPQYGIQPNTLVISEHLYYLLLNSHRRLTEQPIKGPFKIFNMDIEIVDKHDYIAVGYMEVANLENSSES
jgi:hypothetical protein